MEKIKKVFLIDDSYAVNNRNKDLLESMGAFEEIQQYSDPEEALQFFENQFSNSNLEKLPNIIFLDIEMNNMNAYEFLERYRKLRINLDLNFKPYIVIVSDHLFKNDNFDKLKRYSLIGLEDQIPKPIKIRDVETIIEQYIEYIEDNYGRG